MGRRAINVTSAVMLLLMPMVHGHLSHAQGPGPQSIEFAPTEVTDLQGKKYPAEIGTLRVRENRSKPTSNLIELTVIRLKSRSEPAGSPVVYLAGGPGGSATGESGLPFLQPLLLALNENHDLILMDQRGTGRSKPLVVWAAPTPPFDLFTSEEKAMELARSYGRAASDVFKERGIDLSGYNTLESADDLEDLRRAIGAEKLNLIGFSYGTHLALATNRRHGPRLASVVLVGTEGPEHTLKLPSTYDAQLRKISDLAARDPNVAAKVPDMFALLARVLARLEKEPAVVKVRNRRSGQMVDVAVGKFGLQLIIRIDAGDGNDFPEFPALFYTIDRGDYSLLQKYVEKRFNQLGAVSGMGTMMDLFSGADAERLDRIRRESRTALLGNAMNFPDMYIGDIWGNPDLGPSFRSPLTSDTRTLFISGSMDANTPPYQAEQVKWGFSNATHIIVEYAGHEDMLPNGQVRAAIIDFINGKDVSDVRVSLGRPKFRPIP